MKEQKVKSTKRRFSKPVIVFTLFMQLLFSGYMCVLLVFYSPFFNTVKKYLVSSLMETQTKQYIVKMFLTPSEISAIIGNTNAEPAANQNVKNIVPTHKGDPDIQECTVSGSQFNGYVLEIFDPLRVKVAMTEKVGVTGQNTSTMAKENNAVAAINGGGFQGGVNYTSASQYPTNFVMQGGQVVWQDKTWKDYEKVNVIAFDSSGRLIVGNYSIDDLKKLNVMEAVTFVRSKSNDVKPMIVNGKPQYSKGEDYGRDPRTAIAQLKDGTVLMIALDGRQVGKLGATYYEMQQMILDKFSKPGNPVETAAVLDGGGSTTMYYNGEVINHPSSMDGERTVATAFYVKR